MTFMKYVLLTGFDEKSEELLKLKLEDGTVLVKHAFSGESCIALLDTQSVDVIIANLDAPRPNGMDVINFIKNRGLNVPVIVVSRAFLGRADLREHAVENGAYAALERPIVLNDLYETVETALGLKLAGDERRRYPRLPIYLEMDLVSEDTKVNIFKKTHTVDVSLGGLSFEFDICTPCAGYEKGGVHPNCLLRGFWAKERTSKCLNITLMLSLPAGSAILPDEEVAVGKNVLEIKAKVTHIIREKGKRVEYVGVRFVGLDYSKRERLKDFLRKVAEWQKT